MVVMLLGIVTLLRLVQYVNELIPIYERLAGRLMLCKLIQ